MKARTMNIIYTLLLLFCISISTKAQNTDSIRIAIDNYEYEKVLELTSCTDSLNEECTELRLQACKKLNKWQTALPLIQKRLEQDSTSLKSWAEIAECYRMIGNMKKSSEAYAHAVKLSPDKSFFRQKHINTLIALNDLENARKACHDWIARDSTSATAYRLLGETYEYEDPLTAFAGYNAAFRRDSLDPQIITRIANMINNNEQYSYALLITERYRQYDTLNINVNRQNAKAFCMMKMYPKAIERYESLKRMGDNSYLTLFYLGMSYYGNYDFYAAYDNLKKAIEIMQPSGSNTDALYYLAKSAARTSWKEEAVEAMNHALELTLPTDSVMVRLYKGLAECYKFSLDTKGEISALKKQYEYSKENYLLYTIGCRYYYKNDKDNALEFLNRYIKNVPEKKRYAYDEAGNIDTSRTTYYQDALKKIKNLKTDIFFEGKYKSQ